jgi:hypothetical protein
MQGKRRSTQRGRQHDISRDDDERRQAWEALFAALLERMEFDLSIYNSKWFQLVINGKVVAMVRQKKRLD